MAFGQGINDAVKDGKRNPMEHGKLHYKASFVDDNGDTVTTNYKGIEDTYLYLLKQFTEEYEFEEDEYLRFEYNPKHFCLQKFGTEDLWSMLLSINGMYSIMDFCERKILIFTSDITRLVDEMVLKEQVKLNANPTMFK